MIWLNQKAQHLVSSQSILFQWNIPRWHIWWYKSTLCRCLGRGQGPAERKVPWLNKVGILCLWGPLLGGLRHQIQLHSMATPNGVKALGGFCVIGVVVRFVKLSNSVSFVASITIRIINRHQSIYCEPLLRKPADRLGVVSPCERSEN